MFVETGVKFTLCVVATSSNNSADQHIETLLLPATNTMRLNWPNICGVIDLGI